MFLIIILINILIYNYVTLGYNFEKSNVYGFFILISNSFLLFVLYFRLMPQPISLMGAPRPGYRTVSNNLRMAGRGDFGEYFSIIVHSIYNYKLTSFLFSIFYLFIDNSIGIGLR